MSEKQTKNTKEILSNVWNWEHTEDWWRRAIPNPHPILTTEKMLQEIQEKIGNQDIIDTQKQKLYQVFRTRYNCSRVREARQYNTMSQEDFSPLEEDEEIYDEVLNIFWWVSLSRVLSALGNEYRYKKWMLYQQLEDEDWIYDQNIAIRKLLTEDWSDAMLSDQSPETIKAIWEIVCK